MLKLILLKTNPQLHLLGQLTELDEEPSLLIERCMVVKDDGTLEPYPKHTDQRDLFLTSDLLFTIMDPSATIADAYKKATGG
jgi:hypothetical protein